MRISNIELKNVKSFDGPIVAPFDAATRMFAFSGKNGAGKSTLLRAAWLVQKAHFLSQDLLESDVLDAFDAEVLRLLTTHDAYIQLTMTADEVDFTIRLERSQNGYKLTYVNEEAARTHWSLHSPNNLILYVDASKGFSEATLRFDEISIAGNDKNEILREAIYNPEQLFSGIYRQLVKDYVHNRLIPSKPDRLLYYHIASKLFTKLIPGVELKNFSGNHKPKEFVLLGKAASAKYKPLYDVREFSSGEKALLSTLTFLCISKSVSALLIDEPENHFHESLLLEFIAVLHRLTEKGGIHSWVTESAKDGKKLNLDWVSDEYKDHNLGQVVVSTHSKSLIYKFFSIGKNFLVDHVIKEIDYESAESQLRELGLSSTLSKVILVEGKGDNAALEALFKGKNVRIKPLDGSRPVIETFKRLANIKEFVQDAQFVFLIDSDNKPATYFQEIEAIDPAFYAQAFVTLNAHEFENLFLDSSIIKQVVDGYSQMKGQASAFTEQDILDIILELAKESLPQVYKKELSLGFQQLVERHFASLVWGNSAFTWKDSNGVKSQIATTLSEQEAINLNTSLVTYSDSMFTKYGTLGNAELLRRCDGKQVLARVSAHFGSKVGVTKKGFQDAIYHAAITSKNSEVANISQVLMSRLS